MRSSTKPSVAFARESSRLFQKKSVVPRLLLMAGKLFSPFAKHTDEIGNSQLRWHFRAFRGHLGNSSSSGRCTRSPRYDIYNCGGMSYKLSTVGVGGCGFHCAHPNTVTFQIPFESLYTYDSHDVLLRGRGPLTETQRFGNRRSHIDRFCLSFSSPLTVFNEIKIQHSRATWTDGKIE